jgi:tetrahydromethanopterin S-methyltransferase subunit H
MADQKADTITRIREIRRDIRDTGDPHLINIIVNLNDTQLERLVDLVQGVIDDPLPQEPIDSRDEMERQHRMDTHSGE